MRFLAISKSNDEEFIDEESKADEYIIDSNEIVYEEVQNDSKCGFCETFLTVKECFIPQNYFASCPLEKIDFF